MSFNFSVARFTAPQSESVEPSLRSRHDQSVVVAAAASAVPLGTPTAGASTRSTRSRASRVPGLGHGASSSSSRSRASTLRNVVEIEDSPPAKRNAASDLTASSGLKRKRARAGFKVDPEEDEGVEGDRKTEEAPECCICMCEIEQDQIAKISGCSHTFHFTCIEEWSKRENSCPLCKNRFTQIDRLSKKRKKGQKNVKKVRQRDQQADISNASALEGLLGKFG